MQIVTGIFANTEQAASAANYLRQQGFTGEISMIGRHNEEVFGEAKDAQDDLQDLSGIAKAGVAGGFIGLSTGLATMFLPGLGSIVTAGPIAGLVGGALSGELIGILNHWGIPEREGENLRSTIQAGKTVMMLKFARQEDRKLVIKALPEKGAESISEASS